MAAAAGGAATVGARAVFAGVDQFAAQLARLGTQFASFGQQVTGGIEQANESFAGFTGGLHDFNAAVAGTRLAVGTVSTTVSTLTAPFRAVGSAVSGAASDVVEGSGKIDGALKDISDATLGVSEKGALGLVAVGTALTGLGVTAVTESARYERGMRDIQAVTQITDDALSTLDETIRRVAARFPSQIGDIQASARELGKAGVDVNDLTSEIIKLALAAQNLSNGELTATAAAEAIGSNMALFRSSFERSGDTVEQQSRRIINSLTGIANETRASIPEVVSAVNKLGPNLAPLGGTVEQTAALAGVVLKQGPRGQEAGTALANLFQRLENPSREAAQILKERPNLNLFDVEGKARPAIDVIKAFADTYGAAGRAASGMSEATATAELAEIAQTRTLRALNLVLDAGVGSYSEFLDVIAHTDVLAQAEIQNQALIRQLEILRNNAQLAGIAFGRDFVSGLGGAVTKLNDFLRDGERAQQVAGTIGKATAAIITGQGDQEARRSIVQDLGQGDNGLGTQTFDALNAGSEKIRGNIEDLAKDAAHFGTTLGLITFPDGLPGAIDDAAGALSGLIRIADSVVKKFDELAPEVTKRLQEITGASTFEELITHAQAFGTEIGKIFSDNNGDQSLKNLADEATNFFKVLREEGEPTIKSFARLARTIEDTAPAFLRAGETGIRILSTMTQAANALLRVLLRITAFDLGAIGGAFNFLGTGANALLGGIKDIPGNIAGAPGRSAAAFAAAQGLGPGASERLAAGLGGGGLGPDERAAAAAAASAAADAQARQAQVSEADARSLEIATVAMEEAANEARVFGIATDAAADSSQNAADVIGGTEGAYHNDAEAKREAAAADKALESAQRSLSSQMRTLGKDVADAGGSFDKTISGAQQRWLDGLDQIAESTADAVKRIQRTASEARSKALEGFNLQVERGGGFLASLDEGGNLQVDTENFVEGVNTIFRHGQEDRKRDFQQGIEDRQRGRQIADENETRDVTRHNEDITRFEQQGQENVTRARQIGIEDRERQLQRAQDRELLIFQRGQERELTSFTRGQQSANTARIQAREDTRASERLAQDLSTAATPEERTRLLTSFTASRKDVAQQRADQNEDTKYQQQQEDTLTRFRQGQEDTLTKKRQLLEDSNIAHKRELEVSDIAFRRQLEVDLIGFRRDLEDKETERRRTVAALEIANRRKDELEVLGFDRTQQQEAQINTLTTQTIPDLQRHLAEINQQERDQIQNTGETAARSLLRAGLTLRREIQSASVTGVEGLRRLQERFETDAQNALARVPESKRPELQRDIDTQRQVLAAQIVVAQTQQGGRGAQVTSAADAATQAALGQLQALVPDLSSIETIFGAQATANLVTTSLLAAPQVERLTQALEDLTKKIDKVAPGIHVDTVEQTIQTPTTPQGAIIQIGTIAGVT